MKLRYLVLTTLIASLTFVYMVRADYEMPVTLDIGDILVNNTYITQSSSGDAYWGVFGDFLSPNTTAGAKSLLNNITGINVTTLPLFYANITGFDWGKDTNITDTNITWSWGNLTGDWNVTNTSYEYWTNATLTLTYNATYDSNVDTRSYETLANITGNFTNVDVIYNGTMMQCLLITNETERALFVADTTIADTNITDTNITDTNITDTNITWAFHNLTGTLDLTSTLINGTMNYANITGFDWGKDTNITDTNITDTNITDTNVTGGATITGNLTMNDNVHTEYGTTQGEGSMYSNSTCIIIQGATSRLEIC